MSKEESNVSYEKIILDVAENSFAEKGFANTKLTCIAQDANVNHALVHYYYRSKKNLYDCVVKRLFEKWETTVKQFDWDDEEPAKVLTDYISKYFYFHIESENFQKIRAWDAMENINLFDTYTKEYWENDLTSKVQKIEKWKENKLIRDDVNPVFFMQTIWCMVKNFYSYSEEDLRAMYGNNSSISENRERVVHSIAEFIINSIK